MLAAKDAKIHPAAEHYFQTENVCLITTKTMMKQTLMLVQVKSMKLCVATIILKLPTTWALKINSLNFVMSSSNDVAGAVLVKKRGRKRKDDKSEGGDVVADPPLTSCETGSNKGTSARRGRKAKSIVNTYNTHDQMSCGSMSDDENVIVQLNVKPTIMSNNENSTHIAKDIAGTSSSATVAANNNNNAVLPKAYDTHTNNSFASTPMEVSHQALRDKQNCKSWCSNKVVELLKDFEMKSKASEWPSTTNIACYWCCHKFNTVPFGIPVKFYHGKFHVYGCFCSLECAAAYNFNFAESLDEVWERYNLINLLSRKLGHTNKVKTAPNRLALKMFGGHMDIEEFRHFSETSKVLSVNFPPMTTLTQQIEELNECDVNSEYRYIPIDHERINKYKEKLTLRRTKPVTDYKHTLDHMMNLKIQS